MKKQTTFLWQLLPFMGLLWVVTACDSGGLTDAELQGTIGAGVAETVNAKATIDTAVAETVAANNVVAAVIAPSTWTAEPVEASPEPEVAVAAQATNTPLVTAVSTLEIPTNTPIPTATATVVPTNTPEPTQEAVAPPPNPTIPPNPTFGGDILPNGSFEDGWYNQGGISELQLPNGFGFEYDTGRTGFGNEEWDQYYRPETRVWPDFQIPAEERSLFLQDGKYTVKMFKGNGPISFRFFADLPLEAGTYLFRVRAYPDMVMGYNGGAKIFADDPLAGEIRFLSPSGGTGWTLPTFGQWNVLEHTFTLSEAKTVRVGIGARSRFGLQNNGWVFDNWDLHKVEGG